MTVMGRRKLCGGPSLFSAGKGKSIPLFSPEVFHLSRSGPRDRPRSQNP